MTAKARKPRIAVVSPFLDKQHGTERCVVEQLDALADRFEFHIYSSRVDDLDLKKVVWHRVPAIPGPLLMKFIWFFCANRMSRWFNRTFRRLASDLTFSPGINCFDADLIAVHIVFAEFRQRVRKALQFQANPVSFWPTLLHRRIFYRLITFLERRIYVRSDLPLVAVSDKVREDLRRFYGRAPGVWVIYNGIDCGKFSPTIRLSLREQARVSMGYSPSDFVLLIVGNDWMKKGLSCLLKAVALIQKSNLKIAVAGKDEFSPFRSLLAQQGLASAVQFFPVCPDPEVYYAAADMYVGPSLEDAFALPPLEAMACGVPAIVSRQAGVSEVITQGVDGYILEDAEDYKTLAELILGIYEDAPLRQRLGEKAAETARRYTWERSAREFGELLWQALQKKNPANTVEFQRET